MRNTALTSVSFLAVAFTTIGKIMLATVKFACVIPLLLCLCLVYAFMIGIAGIMELGQAKPGSSIAEHLAHDLSGYTTTLIAWTGLDDFGANT